MQGCVGQGQPAERSTDLINMRRVTRRFGSDSLKKMAKVSGDSDSREGLDLSIKEMDLPIKFSDKNELSNFFDKAIASGDLLLQDSDDFLPRTSSIHELDTSELDFQELANFSDDSREGLDLSIKEMDLPIKFSDKNELSMLFDKDIVSGDLSSQGLDDSSTTTFLSNELYTPDLDLKDFFAKLSALSDRSSRRCTQEVSLGVFLEKKTVKKRKISQ